MAKVLSKPKAPKIIEVPVATPTPAPVVETPVDTAPEPTADELRVQNILTRRRGRLGTIITSIKGVLNDTRSSSEAVAQTNKNPARKTLLGE
jgi:hypothetical protein